MFEILTIQQPSGARVIGDLASTATSGEYTRLRAAVAYVTHGGVALLQRRMPIIFDGLQVQLLAGIDWCRSDVSGLDAMQQLLHAEVRIVNGAALVGVPGCLPTQSFHPKGFLFDGPSRRRLISGSANLSDNGLRRAHELDTVISVEGRSAPHERQAWRALDRTASWFDQLWATSTPYQAIRDAYSEAAQRMVKQSTQTEDDVVPVTTTGPGAFSVDQLVRIRKAENFWIDTGANMNLGDTGNQVMMRRNTRVFFGAPATDLPKDSPIGSIVMRFGNALFADRALRYENNGMDVMNMPNPQTVAPHSYINSSILLRRTGHRGALVYELAFLDTDAKRNRAITASKKADLDFKMSGTSQRKFGFF